MARWRRDHPAQPLPGRRHLFLRGRPPVRPAAWDLRRLGRDDRFHRKNPDTAREEYLEAKVTGIEFKAGEYIEFREPNGGGYGDPLERDPALVREDVLDDFTTIELARDAYGVIFADENTLVIDEGATEKQRAEIRAPAAAASR